MYLTTSFDITLQRVVLYMLTNETIKIPAGPIFGDLTAIAVCQKTPQSDLSRTTHLRLCPSIDDQLLMLHPPPQRGRTM
jgi:hypothetical protein